MHQALRFACGRANAVGGKVGLLHCFSADGFEYWAGVGEIMRAEAREDTLRDLLLQFAPVLDNLRRALGQQTQDADSLKQGVELICGQFKEVLTGYGLAEIEAMGQPFDPNLHEALAEVASPEHEPGTVIEEMEKGYKLNDKVVRPARVVVSKASEEK